MSTQAFNHYDKSSQAFMAVIDQMVVLLWSFSTGILEEHVTSAQDRNPIRTVFLNRWAVARYRVLASIVPVRERPDETAICYKISLVQLITNLNVILYLSTCHTVYISVLILFMIMP